MRLSKWILIFIAITATSASSIFYANNKSRKVQTATMTQDAKSLTATYISDFFAKRPRRTKMARIVGDVTLHLKDHGHDLTDMEVAELVYEIIEDKNYATFGDITQWHFSEVIPKEYLLSD